MICLVTWERKLHAGACRGHQGARQEATKRGGGGFRGHQELLEYIFIIWVVSAFHSAKIQDWNFGNFTCRMEWYNQLNWSHPSHCMVGIGCGRAVLETTILSNGKGQWNDQTGQSGPPSEVVAKLIFWSDRTQIVCSIWSLTRNFHNFKLNGKHPL